MISLHIELFRVRIRLDFGPANTFLYGDLRCIVQAAGNNKFRMKLSFARAAACRLSIVSEVLVYGGYLPQLAELNKRKRSLFSRRNGLAFSLLWCLFFLLIMTPLWGILEIDKLAGASAIVGIFGGLMWMISSLIFLRKEPKFTGDLGIYQPQGQYNMPAQPNYSALPPQQSMPASAYSAPTAGSWRDTNDLLPTSVTEGTTKLLEKDEQ